MHRHHPRLSAVILATLVAITGVGAHSAPATADVSYVEGTDLAAPLFDPLKVFDIDLDVPAESIAAMEAQTMCNAIDYQPATLTMTTDTATYGPMTVGIRLKGCWGSFRQLNGKAGFKIKINYISGQTILGLKKLTLNNMVQDPSMLHEAVGYRLFRGVGVAAPRVGYTNVSINGNEYGLHANVETPDKVMLPRWYGVGQTTHLYEGSYWMDAVPDQVNNFEIDEGNDTRTDLIALTNANALTGAAWWSAIQPLADLDQMTTMWATEFYLGHWDGYATRIWNNYYLHSTPDGKFTMLPWGLDQILYEEISYDVAPDNAIMVKRCLAVKACKDLFAENLVEVRDRAVALNLPAMTTAVGNAIDDAVYADPRREVDYPSSVWWRGQARTWLEARPASVTRWVADNTVGKPVSTVRRSGSVTTQSWNAPTSHGLTIDHYQVSVKRNGVWRTYSTTARSHPFTHARNTTLSFRVRAHTVLGYGPWSTVVSLRRN